MIKKFNHISFRWTFLITAVVIIIGAISLTNPKGMANASPTTEGNKDSVSSQNNFPQQPQVLVEVDVEIVERDQKQVDEGHSPWQLSPFAVSQTFVGLQISPDGIQGDFPVDMDDMKIKYETNEEVIVEISEDKSPISRVYLKRLVKQNEEGIWTVVGYDPNEK